MKQDRTVSTARTLEVCESPSKQLPVRPARAPRPGRLVVEYFGDFGPDSRHLDMLSAGRLVSAAGTVTGVQLLGRDEPHAIVTLTGMTGESAQCIVDSEHYLDLWSLCVEGTQVRVSGKVRRPLADGPALIDTLSIVSADTRIEQAEAVNA